MSDFLQEMATQSARRARDAAQVMPLATLRERCAALAPPVPLRRHSKGMSVIAEIKMRSPAEGKLGSNATGASLIERVDQYISAGASALSVLTEPSRFAGSLEHLRSVAERAHDAGVPVMRKDFLVDAYQIYEGRAAGADGVLLIARLLDDGQLEHLLGVARELGMFVLLEAFDRADLERCHTVVSQNVLIGLNCRDLTTLKIDPARFTKLRSSFPAAAIKVAESGIHTAADAVALAQKGYDMALIGTALMKAAEPRILIREILQQTAAAHSPG